MSTLEIETIADDNKKSLYRSQRLKLPGKEIITPLKSLNPSKLRLKSPLNTKAYGFLEIYKSISSEKISLYNKDSEEHDKFSRSLVNLGKRGQDNDAQLCILNFDNPNKIFPNKKEIEFLTDAAYCNSDITPIPMIKAKITQTNFTPFMKYIGDVYKTIEELNHKPIMGYLPNLPRELYPKLLDVYIKKGIRTFYFDFNGQIPDHLKLRPLLKHLNSKKKLDDTLIYGINAKPGKALKNANIIPSKDFLSYGFGIDILGQTHIGTKGSKEFFEKLKKAVDTQQENKKRLFTKFDYGYHKISKKDEMESIYPSDSKIELSDILTDDYKTYQNLFNMEQQGIESSNLRKRLNELDPTESILSYVGKKEQIKKELKHLEKGPKSIL